MKRRPSRLVARLRRLAARRELFLLFVVVLCAVEVLVDWRATLFEINVARDQLRLKAERTGDLLAKAAEAALSASDRGELERLSVGLFDDEDLVYVRFTDGAGQSVYDRLRPDFGERIARETGEEFRLRYRRVLDRDQRGIVADPERLRDKMERSRHKDFIQRYTEWEARLLRRLTGAPSGPGGPPPRVLYQDRLADARGQLDRRLTYAVAAVRSGEAAPSGAVLVGFSTARLAATIAQRLKKGLLVTLFFVGLIVVQNILSRRAGLRLRALEAALLAAREALAARRPPPFEQGPLRVELAFDPSESVGGTLYDLRERDGGLDVLLVVPEGSGVAAAFDAVAVRDRWRERGAEGTPAEVLAALDEGFRAATPGRAQKQQPHRAAPDGVVEGALLGLPPPFQLGPEGARPVALGEGEGPRRFALALGDGALALWDDGLDEAAARSPSRAEAGARLAAGYLRGDAAGAARALVAEARRRLGKKFPEDLLALVIRSAG
jgi:hypothetical protein